MEPEQVALREADEALAQLHHLWGGWRRFRVLARLRAAERYVERRVTADHVAAAAPRQRAADAPPARAASDARPVTPQP